MVSDGTNSATYSYLANSPLVDHIVFAHSGAAVMTNQNTFDYVNRLTGKSSALNFNYQYNAASQRTRVTLIDGSYWLYGYDALGQLTSANKYFRDNTPVAGQQFDYTFDTIGNRTGTQAGGDQTGANLRAAGYTNNLLNQIASRTVPGDVDVMGLGLATNTVSVNGQAAYQKWEYFRKQLAVNNTSAALWTNVTVTAPGQTTVAGSVFVAKNPETFGYDADGNMTNDGRWTYRWDGENRLVNMTSLTNAPTASQYKLDFMYDYRGRRIQKIVSTTTNSGTNYAAQYTNRFVYDGWNPVAILNPASALVSSFVWGTDLSGSMQGAGGVGGLLTENIVSNGVHFVAYDGNGNLAALVNAATGAVSANYEYGPFGEVIRATGPMAKVNPFMFSTKFYDWESGLYYYGYRYYNPTTGRWPSRDPLEEEGGRNLYVFVFNDPSDQPDILGLNAFHLDCGMAGSIQLSWDVCSGKITLNGWFWVGIGYEWNHRFVGYSAYYSGSPMKTWNGVRPFRCGTCSCGCTSADATGLQQAVGAFQGGLFHLAGVPIEGGVLFTPGRTLCDGSIEGILFDNAIAMLPGGALVQRVVSALGGQVEAGIQINVDVHLCKGASGGIVSDSASISGGGYIAIGSIPSNLGSGH